MQPVRLPSFRAGALWALLASMVSNCAPVGSGGPDPRGASVPVPRHPIVFRAEELPFVYRRGATGRCWPVEVTGGGVGLLDFDGDGDLDLFFAQGGPLPFGSTTEPPADVLLRNDGDNAFIDASDAVGLVAKGYGQGVAVGDCEGDGDLDVYVTRYGPDTLWRNDGGRFVDATAEVGLGCPLWGLGAAFLDYDGDGDLDLFVANYFAFDEAAAPFFRDEQGRAEYGIPNLWQGVPDVLYRNDGGRFVDVTAEAGIVDERRGMGVLATDFNLDGHVDLLVANDAEANSLWMNRGDGTFVEVAELAGVGYNAEGATEANMGIAHGDTDGDGRQDLIVSHLFDEHDTLWRLLSDAGQEPVFQDQTKAAGLAAATLPLTTWGNALADFDADGRLDYLVVGGHIRREPGQPFELENPARLLRGEEGGTFRDVSGDAGPFFGALHQARGLAMGDLDGDGDPDAVVVRHDGPAVVLWNETAGGGWVRFELVDVGGRRDPIGARVEVTVGGRTQVRSIDGGGGYLSASAGRVHFGLGAAAEVERVVVRWPSGRVEEASGVEGGRVVRWVEGVGPEGR